MAFNVNYNAGGIVDEVKKIKSIAGGIINEVEQINNIVGGTIDEVKQIDNISTVQKVDEIGKITGFPQFTQPFNTMVKLDVPAVNNDFELIYETPDQEVEILALTVTCSGYGELDNYDLYVNDNIWFKEWYCTEVKEGLFLGTSTFVYRALPKSKFKLVFHNVSGSSKILWFGIRMLVETTPIFPIPETA